MVVGRRINIITSFFCVKKLAGSLSLATYDLANAATDRRTHLAQIWRQQEYLETLLCNVAHPAVERVILLVEGMEALALLMRSVNEMGGREGSAVVSTLKKKIVPLLIDTQPSYAQLFRIANQLLLHNNKTDRRGSLCMVCNADIHLPLHPKFFPMERIDRLFDLNENKNSLQQRPIVLALTRYESEGGDESAFVAPLIDDYRGSHDGFLFEAPLPEAFLRAVQHPQNSYKAENVVLHSFQHVAGALTLNPCRDVRIVHKHQADVRQWLPAVDEGRYARAPPTTLDEAFSAVSSS